MVDLQALVSYHDKDLAKDRGYHWVPESKQWIISLKASDAQVEIAECGFKTQILPGPAATLSAPVPRELPDLRPAWELKGTLSASASNCCSR